MQYCCRLELLAKANDHEEFYAQVQKHLSILYLPQQEPLDGNKVHVHITLLLIHCQPNSAGNQSQSAEQLRHLTYSLHLILHLHLCLWHKNITIVILYSPVAQAAHVGLL